MLYPLNPGAETELRGVMAFQRQVLAFACRAGLAKPVAKADVIAHFGGQAQWFWDHSSLKTRVENLSKALSNDTALASRVLAAYENDTTFDQHSADPGFVFACCTLPQSIKEPVSDLLRQFYGLLGRGFSVEITGGNEITRASVAADFHLRNPDLKVCPACDGTRSDRIRNTIHAQCDHFFPKSIHCALSVHPRNLVPVCLDCNLMFKGENDPAAHAVLSEMFLPYAREAFGPLEAQASRHPDHGLRISLHDGGVTTTARLRALNQILNLHERWSTRLHDRVAPLITNRFRNQLKLVARLGQHIDLLQNITAQRSEKRAARQMEHDSIIAEAYLRFLEVDDSERAQITG